MSPELAQHGAKAGKTGRKHLNSRERLLIQGIAEHGNRIKAWLDAGYTGQDGDKLKPWATRALARILARPLVTEALAQIKTEHLAARVQAEQFTLDWLRLETMDLYKKAREDGELPSAVSCLTIIGKTMGVFSEGVTLSAEATKRYSDAEQSEARRLSMLMLDAEPKKVECHVMSIIGPEDGQDRAGAEQGVQEVCGQSTGPMQGSAGAEPVADVTLPVANLTLCPEPTIAHDDHHAQAESIPPKGEGQDMQDEVPVACEVETISQSAIPTENVSDGV